MREAITAYFKEGGSNHYISRKIDVSVNRVRSEITLMYDEYRKNMIILITLNCLFLVALLVSNLVVDIKELCIVISFFLLIVLICRSLYLLISLIIRLKMHQKWIVEFFAYFSKERSFHEAIKKLIREYWRLKYGRMTNSFTSKIHSFCASIGMVKSAKEIEDEIVEKHCYMIQEYLVANIMRKISLMSSSFVIYVILLQPLVIYFLSGMNVVDILLYPIKMLGLS